MERTGTDTNQLVQESLLKKNVDTLSLGKKHTERSRLGSPLKQAGYETIELKMK